MIRFHALDGSGEGTMTEQRWDGGGAIRWSSSVVERGGGAGGRALRPGALPGAAAPARGPGLARCPPRARPRRGLGAPLIMLFLFVSFTGF